MNIKDNYGLTPLGVAEPRGHSACAELLLRQMQEAGLLAETSAEPANALIAQPPAKRFRTSEATAEHMFPVVFFTTEASGDEAELADIEAFYIPLGHAPEKPPIPWTRFHQ